MIKLFSTIGWLLFGAIIAFLMYYVKLSIEKKRLESYQDYIRRKKLNISEETKGGDRAKK